MNNTEIMNLYENYQSISAYENNTATKMASAVIEKPALSIWMILFPIILVPFMMRQQRYKESYNIFSEGYLYTKNIALDAAYQLFKNETSHDDIEDYIRRQVENKLDSNPKVLNIYQKQIEEIELLTAHYSALFATEKQEYRDMVVSHYQTKANYLSFINQLTQAEKEVSRAVSTTFQNESTEGYAIVKKMEEYLWELRIEEANNRFS